MSEQFDFDKALTALQSGQGLTDRDGILTPFIKQLTEAPLKAKLEAHLGSDDIRRGFIPPTSSKPCIVNFEN